MKQYNNIIMPSAIFFILLLVQRFKTFKIRTTNCFTQILSIKKYSFIMKMQLEMIIVEQ